MLEEYLYIDEVRLRNYADQIGAATSTDKRQGWKVGLSVTGPSVEGSQSSSVRSANSHEMILSLVKYLEKEGSLSKSRPSNGEVADSESKRFVLETMQARKITFECKKVSKIANLQAISVWVSNPLQTPKQISEERKNEYQAVGMFVYLIEGYWKDDKPLQKGFSMFTALNVLLEDLEKMGVKHKKGALTTSRDDFASPAAILERAGGIKGEMRQIKTLYRIRSVSDNKIVSVGVSTIRSYDLFGYPIFIAET